MTRRKQSDKVLSFIYLTGLIALTESLTQVSVTDRWAAWRTTEAVDWTHVGPASGPALSLPPASPHCAAEPCPLS